MSGRALVYLDKQGLISIARVLVTGLRVLIARGSFHVVDYPYLWCTNSLVRHSFACGPRRKQFVNSTFVTDKIVSV